MNLVNVRHTGVFESMQWDGTEECAQRISEWLGHACPPWKGYGSDKGPMLTVDWSQMDNPVTADAGDWIVNRTDVRFSPGYAFVHRRWEVLSPEQFAKEYEQLPLSTRVSPFPAPLPYSVWEKGYYAGVDDTRRKVDGTPGREYTSNPYSLGETIPESSPTND